MNYPSITQAFSIACATLITSVVAAQSISFTTQSGYSGAANVDASAGSSDLGGFTILLTNAFASNSGGTMTFDSGTFTPNSGVSFFATSMPVILGAEQAYTMAMSSSGTMQGVSSSGSFTPLVDFGTTLSTDATSYTLSFGNITETVSSTVIEGAGVTGLGFTVLSRTNALYPLDVTATVTLSDASTASLTDNIGNVQGEDNTFFQFTAPEGKTITSLMLAAFESGTSTPVSTRIGMDNIGFLTNVPEPGAYALLLGLGMVGFIVLKKRRH